MQKNWGKRERVVHVIINQSWSENGLGDHYAEVLEKLLPLPSLEGTSLVRRSRPLSPGGVLSCGGSAVPFLVSSFLHPFL
jgi:hypothetical protein